MESVKIVNLSPVLTDQKFLEFVARILQNNDIETVIETHTLGDMSWPQVQGLLQGSRAAILDLATSEQFIQQIPTLPAEVRTLLCADSMFYQDGGWWPRLNLKEAVRHLIVTQAKNIDIKESAYIIGEGAMLRTMSALAVSFGYRVVYLVGLLEDDLERQKRELQRSFVGVDFRPLQAHQMTMQTTGASLLINTMPLEDNPALMSDLAYFNFMKNNGLVIDLNVFPLENTILMEATQANLRILTGFEVRTQQDFTFIERLGFSSLISEGAYKVRWREYLLNSPQNSSSV
jgi:shikimate dehydrogenase